VKFSIRDLFFVTVIVAILLAWWLGRSKLAAENDELRQNAVRFALRSWPRCTQQDPIVGVQMDGDITERPRLCALFRPPIELSY
jgi:hypothetical protein